MYVSVMHTLKGADTLESCPCQFYIKRGRVRGDVLGGGHLPGEGACPGALVRGAFVLPST